MEAAKMANELVRAAEDRAHRAEDRAIAAESRAAAAEARAVRAEADAERAASEVRAARREVGSRPRARYRRSAWLGPSRRGKSRGRRGTRGRAGGVGRRRLVARFSSPTTRSPGWRPGWRDVARARSSARGGRDVATLTGARADEGDGCERSTGMRKRLRKERTRKSAVGPSDGTRSSARSTRRGGDCASCS